MKTNNTERMHIDLQYIIYKSEELLEITENRYRTTIHVANRAKRKKYEDINIIDDPINKPIIKAVLEIVEEISEPEIITD